MTEYPEIPGIEIEGELGSGAHSVVYRGRQHGVICAVKLPRVRARWTRWIYREAVSLARVKHPLLPAVLEVGAVDELPYLVMELVEGETLAETLARGRLEEDHAVAIARQLASVLAAVHDAGLVHRDVKPRNIVVERGVGGLKLVDFGFATPMERVGAGDTAGTAAYSAPEQLTPPGRVDARADLYAVGRVLYECLSGQLLATQSTDGPFGADACAKLVAHGVSPGLATIVSGLLRQSPDERYPDGHALDSELERFVRGRPVLGPGGYGGAKRAPRLVARDAELERVVGACRELRHGGALVLVRAASGGGKSWLLAAATARARETTTTVAIACRKDDPPLSSLRRIIEGICDLVVSSSPTVSSDDLRAAIENLVPVARLIAPDRLRALALVPSNQGASSEMVAAADSLAEGAAEILLRLAKRVGPTVLVVDDAQWIDPASADALTRIAHRLAEAPVALVFGSRLHPGGIVEQLTEIRPGRTTEVELSGLTEAQVAALIASHLGAPNPDPVLVARIHSMAGGTPLGVIEVLGAFLDAGVVRPHARAWLFDPTCLERVVLPQGAQALLGRRLAELPASTRKVLEAAAILGTSFDETLLARMLELAPDDLAYGLVSAGRAGLVEPEALGRHCFVHDSLREMLVESLSDGERRQLHQRAAEILDVEPQPTFEALCAAAHHFSAGETEKHPARVYRVARAAGEAALARFDNETALRFFAQARRASDSAGLKLDARFFQNIGEAQLRMGVLDESLAAFEMALERTTDARTRAVLLGRISWVHDARMESDRAWEMLDLAFKAIGARMPVEDVRSAITTSARIARWSVGKVLERTTGLMDDEIDLVCALHYQNARLGLQYGKVARVLQSSLESVALSARGGSPSTRARSEVFHALVMTALGRRDLARRSLESAQEIAARHGDAVTVAFCVQTSAVVASWGGDLDQSLALIRECVDVHGPWLEFNEYVLNLTSGELLEFLRGRANDAWPWMERAVERLRRSRTRPVIAEFLIQRVRASLITIGRDVKNDPWLAEQLESLSVRDPGQGYSRLLSWGPRARYYLEAADLGDEFEALVRTFEAEGYNPRSIHLAVCEYYVSVTHARIHQCLRANPAARKATLLPALQKAAADLRACARIPFLKTHCLLADGCIAWFEGEDRKAKELLAEAEELATEQSCPWVLYGVARMRAHMLRAAGKEAPARDQARIAELLAREHGAVMRARWVREEFGLTEPAASRSSSVEMTISSRNSSRTNRQLAALLQVARAPRRDLKAEQQAAAILDELINVLHAERGAIWFQPEPGSRGTLVSRDRGSDVSVSLGADSPRGELLRSVHQSGIAWPTPIGESSSMRGGEFDDQRVLAVPLFLYERPAGALCIERSRQDVRFGSDDRALLALLSHQVPIALEIARLLFERDQLHTSLQQAKKMEAMGQLAGGLAHDFNNMLAAMKVSLSAAQERAALDEELTVELDIIGDAMQRAAQLTGQLLSFSRHQPLPVAVHDVNQLIVNLEPMLRRVAGAGIDVVMKASPAVDAVEVDQGSFDQALVNLLINARDAMPRGGKFTITTKNVVLGQAAAQRLNVSPGEYVEVELADTGDGMNAETMSRIFEPFFTTKAAGRGTGLGLAMVYAFARNCGGSIEVSSEVGEGTQFRIYLKRADRARAVRPSRPSLPAVSEAAEMKKDEPDTILVVDDDDLVRRSIAKILERNGYRVVAASGSVEAIDVARQQGRRIALIILDVLMPGLSGPELGRRLSNLNLGAKMLFVSGFAPESIQIEEARVASELLLQKPFSQAVLLERVRQLMHS